MLVGDFRVFPLLERWGLGAVLKSVETQDRKRVSGFA